MSFLIIWNGDEFYDFMKVLMVEFGGNKERLFICLVEYLFCLIFRISFDFCKWKGFVGFCFEDCFRGFINSVFEK